jgi:DNA polymerase-3 subunit alpha
VGRVEEIDEKISKKGNKFAILNILDLHGNIAVTAFESSINKLKEKDITKPLCFVIHINDDNRYLLKKIISLNKAKKEYPKNNISIPVQQNDQTTQPKEVVQQICNINIFADASEEVVEKVYNISLKSHNQYLQLNSPTEYKNLYLSFIKDKQMLSQLKTDFFINDNAIRDILGVVGYVEV